MKVKIRIEDDVTGKLKRTVSMNIAPDELLRIMVEKPVYTTQLHHKKTTEVTIEEQGQ